MCTQRHGLGIIGSEAKVNVLQPPRTADAKVSLPDPGQSALATLRCRSGLVTVGAIDRHAASRLALPLDPLDGHDHLRVEVAAVGLIEGAD